LKALFIIPSLKIGGAEQVIYDLSKSLSFKNHQISILLQRLEIHKKFSEISNFTDIEESSSSTNIFICYLQSFFWLLKNLRYISSHDVIHVNLTFGAFMGNLIYLFRFLGLVKNIKIIETNHSVGMPIKWWQWTFFKLSSFLRDGYILICDSLDYGLKSSKNKKVSIIKNGIFVNNSLEANKSFSYRICAIGRLVKERDPETILSIFNAINKRNFKEDIYLDFIGDGELKEILVEKTRQLKLSKKVLFLGEMSHPREVLKNYDFNISVGVNSILGIAGLESIAEGVPSIIYQLNADHNSDDDPLWTSSSVEELADRVIELLNNKDEYLNFRLDQYNYVKDNLSLEEYSSKILNFYSSI